MPELNPAVGSVYKAGSTVISSFIVVDSLLRFLIVLYDDVIFTAPPSVPADADPPQVLLLVPLQARQLELLTTVSCYWIG